jgi:hypothetical protein
MGIDIAASVLVPPSETCPADPPVDPACPEPELPALSPLLPLLEPPDPTAEAPPSPAPPPFAGEASSLDEQARSKKIEPKARTNCRVIDLPPCTA